MVLEELKNCKESYGFQDIEIMNLFLDIRYFDEFEKRKDEFINLNYQDEKVQKHLREMIVNDVKRGLLWDFGPWGKQL